MFVDEGVARSLGLTANELNLTPRSPGMRMDRAIARDVISTLKAKAMLPEGKVWVAVKQGWVTLKGQVDRESQRLSATLLARQLVGVRGVTNSITLSPR